MPRASSKPPLYVNAAAEHVTEVGCRVRTYDRREGTTIRITRWGRDRIRWVWVRHDDGGPDRAYGQRDLRRLDRLVGQTRLPAP